MKIQVLGSGCPTCKSLYELTKKAVSELGMNEEIEYITDITKIIELGVMTSPVLVIDGKAVMVGSTSSIDKIKDLIKGNPVDDDKKRDSDSDCDCDNNSTGCDCKKNSADCDCKNKVTNCDCKKNSPDSDGNNSTDCSCGSGCC